MAATKRDLDAFRKAMFTADKTAAKTGRARLRAIKAKKRNRR